MSKPSVITTVTAQPKGSSDYKSQQRALETARRALAILEQQAAGFGSLTIPPHLQIELEDKRKEIAGLEDALRSMPRSDSPKPEPTTKSLPPSDLFICYEHNVASDQRLASYLSEFLTAQGHRVFTDDTARIDKAWLEKTDRQLKTSDLFVVLLSGESADSEMIQGVVRRAHEYKSQGGPQILPVRLAYQGMLPYSIEAFLDPQQYLVWQDDADNERVGREILAAAQGHLPQQAPIPFRPASGKTILSEDGRVVTDHAALHQPLPEFDPRFLDELEAPGGTSKLRDKFYMERKADAALRREIVKSGTTTVIRAARQTGKSSLLARGMHHARENGAEIVYFDLQAVASDRLRAPDTFLRDLAECIVHSLRRDVAALEQLWPLPLGPQDKLTRLLEDNVLAEGSGQIVLALDEADRLLPTPFSEDFFALIRYWHNRRASVEQWNRLNIAMVISTEPYLLIADETQSPFNVGLKLYLEDFDEAQVRDLDRRHGAPVKESELPQLMTLLSGHPYLTRKALYTMVTEQLEWAALLSVAAADHGPFGDHLRHHYRLLRNEPDLRAALKDVIRHDRCPDERAFFRLLRAGLVKGSGDVCQCRCDLYRMYLEDKL